MNRIILSIITIIVLLPGLLIPGISVSAALENTTIGSSGWVTYNIGPAISDTDIFWGYDIDDEIFIDTPQIWDSDTSEWVDITGMITIENTYDYNNMNTWGIVNIGAHDDVIVRIWVELPWYGLSNGTGDYYFGYKQSSLKLSQAMMLGNYCTTSWEVEWGEVIEVVFNNPGAALTGELVEISLDDDDIDWLSVQADGDDIRFIDNNNQTVLDYQFNSFTYGVSADIWVDVPEIDGSSNYDSILLYYGNDTATSGETSGLADPSSIAYSLVDITTNPPLNLSYEVIEDNRVLLSWQKGIGTHNTYIVRGLGAYPESITDGTVVYYGFGTSCIDTDIEAGLSPNLNTYYYRAWSENVLGEVSADYAQKEVTGIMSYLILTLGISAFAFWKREVWLYIIAVIAVFFFTAQLFEINMYMAIAPFLLSLYMIFKAATAWYLSKRG